MSSLSEIKNRLAYNEGNTTGFGYDFSVNGPLDNDPLSEKEERRQIGIDSMLYHIANDKALNSFLDSIDASQLKSSYFDDTLNQEVSGVAVDLFNRKGISGVILKTSRQILAGISTGESIRGLDKDAYSFIKINGYEDLDSFYSQENPSKKTDPIDLWHKIVALYERVESAAF